MTSEIESRGDLEVGGGVGSPSPDDEMLEVGVRPTPPQEGERIGEQGGRTGAQGSTGVHVKAEGGSRGGDLGVGDS